jgi:hypothetical protein
MITPFTTEEGSLLVRILIAHCTTDFILQSAKSIKDKQERIFLSTSLYKHIGVLVVLTWVSIWDWKQWQAVAIIAISHLVIDAAKLWANKSIPEQRFHYKDIWLFSLDQLLHIIVIVWVWLHMIGGYHSMYRLAGAVLPDYALLLRVLGYLVLTGPVTYLIRFLTKRWSEHLDTREGLEDAGKWIGILERILIITLVFINQYTAIGFLVGAKSILRLIDKPDISAQMQQLMQKPVFNSRKHTEYVLIGTFLSFGFAVATGLIINWLLAL